MDDQATIHERYPDEVLAIGLASGLAALCGREFWLVVWSHLGEMHVIADPVRHWETASDQPTVREYADGAAAGLYPL